MSDPSSSINAGNFAVTSVKNKDGSKNLIPYQDFSFDMFTHVLTIYNVQENLIIDITALNHGEIPVTVLYSPTNISCSAPTTAKIGEKYVIDNIRIISEDQSLTYPIIYVYNNGLKLTCNKEYNISEYTESGVTIRKLTINDNVIDENANITIWIDAIEEPSLSKKTITRKIHSGDFEWHRELWPSYDFQEGTELTGKINNYQSHKNDTLCIDGYIVDNDKDVDVITSNEYTLTIDNEGNVVFTLLPGICLKSGQQIKLVTTLVPPTDIINVHLLVKNCSDRSVYNYISNCYKVRKNNPVVGFVPNASAYCFYEINNAKILSIFDGEQLIDPSKYSYSTASNTMTFIEFSNYVCSSNDLTINILPENI